MFLFFQRISPIFLDETDRVIASPLEPSLPRHADSMIVGIHLQKQPTDDDEEEGADTIQKFPPKTQFGLHRVLVIHSLHQ